MVPVLQYQDAFDSKLEHEFTFSYIGDQAFSNRLVIRNNETNTVVYDKTQESFKLTHTLPSNSLVNGVCYNAELEVLNKTGVSSGFSKKIVYYCYTTPTYTFENISQNMIIAYSSIQAELVYFQPEGEPLNSYQILVYNGLKSEIYRSGVLYNTEYISAYLNGFENGHQYYIRAIGETLNKMQIDTGYILVSVKYITPSFYSILVPTNVPDEGHIRLISNISVITGTSNPSPPIYLDDTKVDLTQDGHYVQFEEGFGIEGDFTLELIGQNLPAYSDILELTNKTHSIDLRYMLGTFDGVQKAYFVAKAYNNMTSYVATSNLIDPPTGNQEVVILLRRVNSLYQLVAKTKEVEVNA